jgi:probable rRNA maturation factor
VTDRTEGGLTVTVTDGRGRAVPRDTLGRWLASVAPPRARGRVTLALVSDRMMRQLNRRYRGADYATDVLSFANEADDAMPAGPAGASARRAGGADLGDIVIATGVARRQARDAGHAPETERRILALHGLLHLMGYDHERDAGLMRRVEERLRRKAGLPAGLITRTHRRS